MKKTIIIAEAGVNHNGDINLAKKLIEAAASAGADYVKFQTFITELIVDRSAPKADYQNATVGQAKSQFDMIKELELSFDDFKELKSYCKHRGIKFLTTVADLVSLKRLPELDVDFIKISSGELSNPLFLKAVAKQGKPVVLSTGMATLGEVERALDLLTSETLQRNDITLLHCNTEYPTPMRDVNLAAMVTMREAFKINVGYSDHTLGIEIPIAAVALGATVIEKHLTLDKAMSGPDHASSLEPAEFQSMVLAIRNIDLALGDGVKRPSASESKNIMAVRKSMFAAQDIRLGEPFSEINIMVKRPGDGVPASAIDSVLGKVATRNIKAGEKLDYKSIAW